MIKFKSLNNLTIGPSNGNEGALIRWGKYLDNGIWYRSWKFKNLWFGCKFKKHYVDLGLICIMWGN